MPRCREPSCNTQATFGTREEGALCCMKHNHEGFKNVKDKLCEYNGCEKRPSFGYEWRRPLFCFDHNFEKLDDVINKRCMTEGCMTKPSYGTEMNKPLYCVKHAPNDMELVIGKFCTDPGCKTVAKFGIDRNQPLYCSKHVPDGIKKQNVVHPTCLHEGCTLIPKFGKDKNKGLYCKEHKPIDIDMENVCVKMCEHEGCGTIATYGSKEDMKPLYCRKHSFEKMVDVRHPMCLHEACGTRPVFGKKKGKPMYCFEHNFDKLDDVVNNRCKNYDICFTSARLNHYEGYCTKCFAYTFPEKPLAKNYKTKESEVQAFMKSTFPNVDISFDKRISGGCSLRRPDALIDMGHHVVVVEVDENQHGSYSCEEKRMLQIIQDCGERDTIFVRINPDAYMDSCGGKHQSCFKVCRSTGLVVVRDAALWRRRLEAMGRAVRDAISHPTGKLMHVVSLFFDGYGT
jgi:hypothetical protein